MDIESKFKFLLDDNFCITTNSRKSDITRYIRKHFILDKDYKINFPNKNKKGGAGRNKQDYILTEDAFNLLKNSYKLRQIDLGKKNITHPILIYIETATIGFIYDVYSNDFKIEKQYNVKNKFFIDLYFIDKKLAIECDEEHHLFNKENDIKRENFIKEELNCSFYRYNPSKIKVSNIISELNKLLFLSLP